MLLGKSAERSHCGDKGISWFRGQDSTFLRRKTYASQRAMYMGAGTCYVYITYGIHHCFNISSGEEGIAVLIRALCRLMEWIRWPGTGRLER